MGFLADMMSAGAIASAVNAPTKKALFQQLAAVAEREYGLDPQEVSERLTERAVRGRGVLPEELEVLAEVEDEEEGLVLSILKPSMICLSIWFSAFFRRQMRGPNI